MTHYTLVEQKLENFPDFRERKLRSKYLVVLAMRVSGFNQDAKITDGYDDYSLKCLDDFAEFAIVYDSLRHAWTDVLRDRKDLRGTDYEDKKELEQKKQIELGYEVGYTKDILSTESHT